NFPHSLNAGWGCHESLGYSGQLTRDLRKPDPQDNIDLISESQKGGEFSTCFTELQKRFLSHRCSKLKNLIQLVKHWYSQCKEKMDSLPPQYALELLIVYAWEHGSQETNFPIAWAFHTVLYLIQKYPELMIYWTINYAIHNEIIADYTGTRGRPQLSALPFRPVILDPADPTGDVGGRSRWHWDNLAQGVHPWSSAPCFQNWDGTWVQPWNVLHPSCSSTPRLMVI
uniref:2'-5'-oligoadenylate synthase 1-like n=1 Tax=Phascolarctos cinereus TaxID=38626 RepID=A0A6P5JHJ7_PHACI